MRIVMFYHSLLSDWNHGNAHFLRGVVTELLYRGHDVRVYEPKDAWSVQNLLAEYGEKPVREFRAVYPQLKSVRYDLGSLDVDRVLDGADLVVVHEWNDHDLVSRIGEHHAHARGYFLLFHDTHHRSVTDSKNMAAYGLKNYDGVLAFGSVIRDLYLSRGWIERAWTWHEAADTRVFHPIHSMKRQGDIVWVGNWGDEERTEELYEFLLKPVKSLGLKAQVYGVRYPEQAKEALADAGIEYSGWLPNYKVPQTFALFRCTLHIPRRPYVEALPGVPTIRVFEALACGIPLISAPWDDVEGLFTPGSDFLIARDGREMEGHLKALLQEQDMAREIAGHGLSTIHARHTCAHRVDELLGIYSELRGVEKKVMEA